MIIYLKHFIYGTKVATIHLEAEADEKNGWVRYTPGTPLDEQVEETPMNALGVRCKYTRKTVTEGV